MLSRAVSEPSEFTVLGWEVPDTAASVKALAAKGVSFMRIGGGFPQDDLGIWAAPGGAKMACPEACGGSLLGLRWARRRWPRWPGMREKTRSWR